MQIYEVLSRGRLAGVLAPCILSVLVRWLTPQLESVTPPTGIARAVLDGAGLPAPFAG